MQGKDIGRRYEIIVKVPRVIYILRTRFGKFKGIALCQPEDEFDRDIGVKIAYTKAKMKELTRRLKVLRADEKILEKYHAELDRLRDKVYDEIERIATIQEEMGVK